MLRAENVGRYASALFGQTLSHVLFVLLLAVCMEV